MRALGVVLSLVLAGCTAESVLEPRPSSVWLVVENPDELAPSAPLRYALVFAGAMSPLAVAVDAPVVVGQAIEAPLVTPGPQWELDLYPVESVVLPSLNSIHIYRPRLLVYEDLDGSESLGTEGEDRVLAIDGSTTGASVAAVLELDAVLERMSLEETESFYAASGGVYTPFIRVDGARGYLQLVSALEAGPVTLRLNDSPIPAEQLVCGRSTIYLYGDPLRPAERIAAQVESTLDAGALCGSMIAACTSTTLETLEAPDLRESDTLGLVRVVQCRRNDSVEALVVHEARVTCGECRCQYDVTAEVYYADPLALPAWWPCGTTIPYCEPPGPQLPLYTIDPGCIPADSEE